MILYHGSNVIIDSIDLSTSTPYKDFGRGFYLTSIKDQAVKMAKRTARFYRGEPKVTTFEAPDDLLSRPGLNARVFDHVSEEWAIFIMNNRDRGFSDISSPECNTDATYDVVFGPVGDDDITFLLRQYSRGYISPEALHDGLEFKKASDHYSCHIERAIELLRRVDT